MANEEESRLQGVSELNAVGTARYVGQRMGGEGGNNGKGFIDQYMPTANIAKGNDVTGSVKDDFKRGARADASFTRNDSLTRKERRR